MSTKHRICPLHGQRWRRCTKCWELESRLPVATYNPRTFGGNVFTDLCRHGRRKDYACAECGRKRVRPLCFHGRRRDKCKVCLAAGPAAAKRLRDLAKMPSFFKD